MSLTFTRSLIILFLPCFSVLFVLHRQGRGQKDNDETLAASFLLTHRVCICQIISSIYVCGAGRGPLVAIVLRAMDRTGRVARVYAVEKNAAAFVTSVFSPYYALSLFPLEEDDVSSSICIALILLGSSSFFLLFALASNLVSDHAAFKSVKLSNGGRP